MNNDSMSLLDENFNYIIEDLREQGMINEKQNDNLVNVVGNVVKDPVQHTQASGHIFKYMYKKGQIYFCLSMYITSISFGV